MKQKITMRSKGPSKQLPKSLQDTKPHNLTIYYCLKDNQEVNVKPMIMFAKMKDNRLKNINILDISEVTKKSYVKRTYCILMKGDSNQYVVFKHYFEEAMRKYIVGTLEPTQEAIERYAK